MCIAAKSPHQWLPPWGKRTLELRSRRDLLRPSVVGLCPSGSCDLVDSTSSMTTRCDILHLPYSLKRDTLHWELALHGQFDDFRLLRLQILNNVYCCKILVPGKGTEGPRFGFIISKVTLFCTRTLEKIILQAHPPKMQT